MLVQRLLSSLAFILFFAGSMLHAQVTNLMPQPARISEGEGRLSVTETFSVALTGYREPRLEAAASRLIARLSKQTGIPLLNELQPEAAGATLVIYCDRAGQAVQSVTEDESYKLAITPQQARLTAATPVGVLRGMETILQLLTLDEHGFALPVVQIEDQPRFPWRGLLIDGARHWMPMPVIKRNLDAMAALKLNVLHWHLSDDQGFRVESRQFPKLQGQGSDGHFFTQEEVREVIGYARDRGIRVVPEFDMPGHTTSWFVGYPELASAPGPYSIERGWGIFDPCIDPTRDEVYTFLDGFIGEMAALFPDAYFHVGGDEVNGKAWSANPRIQAFMREHQLKSNEDLQAYFNGRLLPLVQKHGKKMIGWDEILHPGLPKDIVVQSWRGQKSLAVAARQGFMGILSYGYYLDLMQPASYHYSIDPLEGETAGLTAEEKAHILGGEACMWSEMVTPENIEGRLWPRLAAVAERLWSPQEVKDVASMYRRLEAVNRDLDWLGNPGRENSRLMFERLAGTESPHRLEVLSSVLEPVKFYARGEMRPYTSFTPLNRLVDATAPESNAAREFGGLVEHLDVNKDRIRQQLTLWNHNSQALLPSLQRSGLLQETVPLAQDVAALSAAGLKALDYLAAGQHAPEDWVREQTALLDRAAKPRAELLIMIVPSIRKLVEAAR